jgi:hypothetical protein
MLVFLQQELGSCNNRITAATAGTSATARKASTAQRQKQQGSQKQQDANSGDRQERWNTKKSLISELGTAWAVGNTARC